MTNRRSLLLTSLTLGTGLAATWLSGCGGGTEGSAANPAATPAGTPTGSTPGARLQIVCTTTMIGDVVGAVAGDLADVHALFGPTVDPHLFRATRDDVARLMSADLVFSNGFGLEGYLEPTLRRVEEAGVDLIEVVPTILKSDEALTSAGTPDPHVWMDPSLWSRLPDAAASAIEVELAAGEAADDSADTPSTEPRAALALRASEVTSAIAALHAAAEAAVASIPAKSRVLVTAHDAFGYFGRRYGLRVEGIQGLSTASESGLKAIEELVDLLVASEIPAVFFESTVSERNVRALVEGAAARGHAVEIGGVLHSDAPGSAGNYLAMMAHNIDTIAGSLGGRLAPTDGAQASESTDGVKR